ncbi:MAG: hypothetical protein JF590_05740, partial [Gemmatimonadetes bacterium]|nr:hypothetical protein [Gemmatimonadota bacterium]
MRTPSQRALGALILMFATASSLAAATRGPFDHVTLPGILDPIRGFFREAPAPTPVDHIVTISSDSRVLTFKLTGGGQLELALTGGRVIIDGTQAGRYAPGGTLEGAWQDLLADLARVPTPLAVLRARAWSPAGLVGDELAAATELRRRLTSLPETAGSTPAPQPIPAAAPGGLVLDLHAFDDLGKLEPTLWRASQLSGPDL